MGRGVRWLAAALFAASPANAAALPECSDAATAELPAAEGIAYAHSGMPDTLLQMPALRMLSEIPVLRYPFGSLEIYGFDLTFVVGIDGRVSCATLKPAYGAKGPALNEQRTAFLEGVSSWRFEPYRIKGKPTAVVETLTIREEELPETHVAKPAGDPKEATITQDMRPWLASFGPYHVELHGDGTAIYTSAAEDDPLGPQTYHVDPKAVTGLVTAAEAADFWSQCEHWPSPNRSKDDESFERLNITLGGVTKSLTDHFSDQSGLPQTVTDLQNQVMSAAQIEFWQIPTLATLEQLKTNNYNFLSAAAGRLLLQVTQKPDVNDETILALMALGAPQDATGYNTYRGEYQNLLGAALVSGRTAISAKLIAGGALLSDGKIDHEKANSAFYDAVGSGKLAAIDQVLPFKPDMTFAGPDDVKVSILLRLGDAGFYHGERIAAAKRLLELGADINSADSTGATLLHKTLYDRPLVEFLLDHGANINAIEKEGLTPLASTSGEDMAMLLLERGANPRLGKTPERLRFNIKHNHWMRAKAWLHVHGYADVLVPQSDDT